MDEMDRAHRKDYQLAGFCDEAARALTAVLNNSHRLSEQDKRDLQVAHSVLNRTSANIVAVWD